MNDTPETDAARHDLTEYGPPVPCSYGDWVAADFALKLERERDEAREQSTKLKDIAERAIELAMQYYDGPCERDAAKLRAELDQLKEEVK